MDALDDEIITTLSDGNEIELVAVNGGGKSFGPRVTSMAQVEALLAAHREAAAVPEEGGDHAEA